MTRSCTDTASLNKGFEDSNPTPRNQWSKIRVQKHLQLVSTGNPNHNKNGTCFISYTVQTKGITQYHKISTTAYNF